MYSKKNTKSKSKNNEKKIRCLLTKQQHQFLNKKKSFDTLDSDADATRIKIDQHITTLST